MEGIPQLRQSRVNWDDLHVEEALEEFQKWQPDAPTHIRRVNGGDETTELLMTSHGNSSPPLTPPQEDSRLPSELLKPSLAGDPLCLPAGLLPLGPTVLVALIHLAQTAAPPSDSVKKKVNKKSMESQGQSKKNGFQSMEKSIKVRSQLKSVVSQCWLCWLSEKKPQKWCLNMIIRESLLQSGKVNGT